MNVVFPTIPTAPVTQVFNNLNPALYGGDQRHKGIDYGIMPGTAVYACMDGTVKVATTSQTGYGRHIRILHPDGSLSIYGHLNKLLVTVGENVKAGDLIGLSGGDPRDKVDGDGVSTGAHLHWEIRPPGLHASDQTAVDPMAWCLKYLPEKLSVAEVIAYGGLNVRSEPDAGAIRLSALYRKERVHVVERSGNWARLRSLRPEWVSATYLNFTGETIEPVVIEPTTPPVEPTIEEKVRRLWEAHTELH
jgi:murein DD-endopeptidase MepM/ murein hydrolase activator NlpD